MAQRQNNKLRKRRRKVIDRYRQLNEDENDEAPLDKDWQGLFVKPYLARVTQW